MTMIPRRASSGGRENSSRPTWGDVGRATGNAPSRYRGDRPAHFKQWHVDADEGGDDAEDARAITVVALLAEPGADFDGGAFEATRGVGDLHFLGERRGETGGISTHCAEGPKTTQVMTPRWPGGVTSAVAWGRGDLIAFPAKKGWHRAMPTPPGLRRTLVVWAQDPTIVTKESE